MIFMLLFLKYNFIKYFLNETFLMKNKHTLMKTMIL